MTQQTPMESYAIVRCGARQYRVAPGDVITVERLQVPAGDTVVLGPVLLVRQGDEIRVGRPEVGGARVTARVLEHGRGDKIWVFKYKPKVNYRRRFGHRQPFTRVRIEQIELDGAGGGEELATVAAAADAAR